jgi:DNA-binding response OmpR family regulator/anti-sigma regulatory factor (Ser/Thr protein kinase)
MTTSTATQPATERTGARRVLIVDDNEANVLLLQKHLEREYEVHVAYDGEAGLDKVREVNPDLILLDIMLPGMDGYQVCEKLKNDDATRFIPIIMLTNLNDLQDKIKGLDMGADDFLVKPFDKLELFSRVKNLIRVKTLIEDKIESERRLELEKERRQIMRDVIFAVSGGKLVLAEESELEAMRNGGQNKRHLDIGDTSDVGKARTVTEEALLELKMDRDRIFDMVLCVSEATTNALKHARGGSLDVYSVDGRAQVWVSDRGGGIDFSLLPRSTLMKGWSSKTSLGYGYTILLELLDRVLLSTSRFGTTVVMEMSLQPLPDANASADRFLADWKDPEGQLS